MEIRSALLLAQLLLLAAFSATATTASLDPLPPIRGNVSTVIGVIERTLPGASNHFVLEIDPALQCSNTSSKNANRDRCFRMEQDVDSGDERIRIRGTTASELSAAVGVYFREACNFTIGWKRGGSTYVFQPSAWPPLSDLRDAVVGDATRGVGGVGSSGGRVVSVLRSRIAPFSYIMNVCTHSYSLVWYDWPAWERFIDWMALSGINFALAMTGQEEVQYKVFAELGVSDIDIRSWFNGPAFLTWSRGQNEYGAGICGNKLCFFLALVATLLRRSYLLVYIAS